MPFLLNLSIGPVQDFIASARRSRDLWFGSWLLSELSKTAARKIVELNGRNLDCLIFPRVAALKDLAEDSQFNVVNKILAIIESPHELGVEVYAAMQKRLDGIRDDAFQNIDKSLYPDDLQEKARAQIRDLLEYFWVAVRINDPSEQDEYQKAREKLEYLLVARKATHLFGPTRNWSGNFPKSSLDGQRESVIREKVYDDLRSGKIKKERLRSQLGIREAERLCGVGLLKRLGSARDRSGNRTDSFASTSHMASLPLLKYLECNETKSREAFNRYVADLSGLLNNTIEEREMYKFLGKTSKSHPVFKNYDGRILFTERLDEFFTDKTHLSGARKALSAFYAEIGVKQSSLIPYYAVLFADGDAMGKAIAARKSRLEHQQLSAELSEFARGVEKIIETDYQGTLIYSGGDDVLALLPLHTVLSCAAALSNSFAEKLAALQFNENEKIYSPTLSVGIAVVHHLDPLEDALELARRAERAAKSVEGKNALALIVEKRSGATRTREGSWGTLDRRLSRFIDWHRREEIPDGAAYQLRDLANRLTVSKARLDHDTLSRIERVEARRILQRKRSDLGQQCIGNETLSELDKALTEISVRELADELIIAKIFADAENLAEGKKTHE